MDQPHLIAGIHQVLERLGVTARRWRTDRMAAVVAPGTDKLASRSAEASAASGEAT